MNSATSDLENAWKDSTGVFEQQLALNKQELAGVYPKHWMNFLRFLHEMPEFKEVLDIGCGTGAYAEILRRHFPSLYYAGIDYSEEAITLANANWADDTHKFMVQDYKKLNPCIVSKFDLIHMGAFLDVLPNGDEALDFILSLQPKAVYIGRMLLSSREPSGYQEYVAYNSINTCRYIHNFDVLQGLLSKHNYSMTPMAWVQGFWTNSTSDNDIFLRKQ